MSAIMNSFNVTKSEYEKLDKAYGALTEYASWQLIKKNSRNNHTDEQQDIAQELKIALVRAGSYYKRQVYIEKCLNLVEKYVKDSLTKYIVDELKNLWLNKTRHGASRQKFGCHQEKVLDQLVEKLVPKSEQPSKEEPLQMDLKFSTYCKAITWNAQKALGKKITREKGFRSGMVSLSEFDYVSHFSY